MLKESTNRSKADREIIVKAASAKNNCFYCVVTHGALLRIYGKNPITADQVAMNHHKADITSRQKAVLDYAIRVYSDSQSVEDTDHAALRVHGFDDEDICDIAAITAFCRSSSRMVNVISVRLNAEFYLMGRVPTG